MLGSLLYEGTEYRGVIVRQTNRPKNGQGFASPASPALLIDTKIISYG